MQVGLKG